MRVFVATMAVFVLPFAGSAHHAVAGFFDPNESIELEGVVTEIVWRNPHTEFRLNVVDPSGQTLRPADAGRELSFVSECGADPIRMGCG